MKLEKYSNTVSIVVGIVVLVLVSLGSYSLGFYHGLKKYTFTPLLSYFKTNDKPKPSFTPLSSKSPSSTVSTICRDENLGISIKVPKGWICNSKKLSSSDSSISLTSNFFNITISNISRNEFCISNFSVYGYDPNCIVTKFYSTPGAEISLYKYRGEDKEIYGSLLKADNKPGTPVPWISVKYQNMGSTPLSDSQKNELIEVVNSISSSSL